MSRSYRKPYYKDCHSGKKQKRIANRRFRSTCRQIMHIKWKEYQFDSTIWWYLMGFVEEPHFPLMKEVFDQYDIYDLKFYIKKDDRYWPHRHLYTHK